MKHLGFALALIFAAAFRAPGETPLTVSAAASLRDALTEIKTLHAAAHPEVAITFVFGGSGQLQQQIENGAPVDLFISAAPRQMDALEKHGLLLPGTRRDLLGNSLVLITPKSATAVNDWRDLAKPEIKHIAIGEPKSVPAGIYATEVFLSLKMSDAIAAKLVGMLDVRQVLTSVETGNADAGVVYLTDAKTSEKVRIVSTAPTGSHAPIIYPIAVIKDSKHAVAAKGFVEFLFGENARAVFAKFGFTFPDK